MKLNNVFFDAILMLFVTFSCCSENPKVGEKNVKDIALFSSGRMSSCLMKVLDSYDSNYQIEDSIVYLLYFEKQSFDSLSFLITSTKTLSSIDFNYLPTEYLFFKNKLVLYFDEFSMLDYLQSDSNTNFSNASVKQIADKLVKFYDKKSEFNKVENELEKLNRDAIVRNSFKWRIVFTRSNCYIQKSNVQSPFFLPNLRLKKVNFSQPKVSNN